MWVVVVMLVLLGIVLQCWIQYNTALTSSADFKEITAVLFVLTFANRDIRYYALPATRRGDPGSIPGRSL